VFAEISAALRTELLEGSLRVLPYMVPALTVSVLEAGVWNFDLKAYSFASAL
jgi:hypothetical protein